MCSYFQVLQCHYKLLFFLTEALSMNSRVQPFLLPAFQILLTQKLFVAFYNIVASFLGVPYRVTRVCRLLVEVLNVLQICAMSLAAKSRRAQWLSISGRKQSCRDTMHVDTEGISSCNYIQKYLFFILFIYCRENGQFTIQYKMGYSDTI